MNNSMRRFLLESKNFEESVIHYSLKSLIRYQISTITFALGIRNARFAVCNCLFEAVRRRCTTWDNRGCRQ